MKRKDLSLTAMGLLLVSLVMTAGYGYWRLDQAGGQGKKASRQGPMQPIQLPPETDLKAMRELEEKLPDLAHARTPDTSPVNLELFGYQPTVRSSVFSQALPEQQQVDEVFNYHVTFALTAGSSGFCLVDGMLHSEGAVLPDGGVIVKIEADKVLIRKNAQSHWLAVSAAEPAPTPRTLEPKDEK